MNNICALLSAEFHCKPVHAENIIALVDEGNTIPFIARYRKEMTGSIDDQLLREFCDRLSYLRGLDKRREEISATIEQQGKLTEELRAAISSAATLSELEDIYRPYRPKRRTRATVARERGLEPLAALLLAQEIQGGSLLSLAAAYVSAEKGVETPEAALAGASDIIAEEISDRADLRALLRSLCHVRGMLVSTAAKDGDSVYRLYYDYSEPLSKLPSHRILALNRGEREAYLNVSVQLDDSAALNTLYHKVVKPGSLSSEFVRAAAEDAYGRLLFPSLEREIRNELTDRANEQAIKMFALNLKPLLLQPPVKNKVTLGLDPAYRTGCKIAVVDPTGKVLETTVIYPTPPHNKIAEAKEELKRLIKRHGVAVISIGNGTASGESERFVASLIAEIGGFTYMVVNEAGASVYSASKLAAEEFPEFDVSLRSAVSIARRLQDPLAELVKIDPKSIGVGQYQHDMPQARLSETLSGVVEGCVNAVGVDLNTASAPLLTRVAGLSASLAKNIVHFREENGAFCSRKTLLKVPKLGPKAFEQCAGFLRVPGSVHILDNTAVHPESYAAAEKLLALCGYSLEDVKNGNLNALRDRITELGEPRAAAFCGVGIPTVRDMITELLKPGRDMRDELPPPLLRSDVLDIKDVKPGMTLRGTVRNIVDFGVFVDIGVHQDGLVHVSELCSRFVRHPSEVVTVGDIVDVAVLTVEVEKKRISLSMKQAEKNIPI